MKSFRHFSANAFQTFSFTPQRLITFDMESGEEQLNSIDIPGVEVFMLLSAKDTSIGSTYQIVASSTEHTYAQYGTFTGRPGGRLFIEPMIVLSHHDEQDLVTEIQRWLRPNW